MTTKASILECAVKSLHRLQTLYNQLVQSNKQLQKENKRLRAELAKHSPSFHFSGEDNSPIEEFGSIPPPLLNFDELSAEGILGENGPFPDFGYSSPITSSPVSTNVSPQMENDLSSFDEEKDYFRVSKRRLLVGLYVVL
jgi:hypothetical protein